MAANLQEQQQQRRLSLLERCCSCAEPSCDMQLLECLHWFCKGCLHLPVVKGVPATSPDRGSDCRSSVAGWQQALRCPLCSENIARLASVTRGNRFSSTTEPKASGDRRICDMPACGPCTDAVDACENAAAAPNVASCWCATCNMFLCDSCIKLHARFAPTHRDSVTILQPPSGSSPTKLTVATRRPIDTVLPNVVAPSAGLHECACSLFCLVCHRPACSAAGCFSACVDARHSLAAVDGERMRTVASNAAQKLLASKNAASGVVNVLRGRRGSGYRCGSRPLPPSQTPPDGSRAEAAALLDKHRQSALDVLRTVRDRAVMRTRAVYDAVQGRGRGSRSFQCELAGTARMTEQARRYGITLMIGGGSSKSDSTHVLQQQRLVLWRVRSLMARIEHLSRLAPSTKMPFAVHKRQSASMDSDELPKIVASWIGTPRIAGNQVSKTVIAPCASITWPTSTAALGRRDNSDNAAATTAPSPRSLRFGPMRSSFVTKCPWRDVTVSADGSVLVAALQDGMCEYSSRGELIGSWRPPRDLGTSVFTLRALSDGRVVVGVFFAHCVVVLRRAAGGAGATADGGSARWQMDRRVAVRALPQHVTTLGSHLVAVAGTRTQDHGYELDVVRLGGGSHGGDCTVLARTLDFVVILTALTARAIVLSTGEKRRLDGSCGPAVEAYSYGWMRLWQLSVASDVMDIWPQPCGHVITLGVGRERKMMAVDASSGLIVDDQAARIGASLPVSKPCSEGMAAYYDGRRALLAVALPAESSNSATIEWYPSTI